jgi:hypothetical protein
VFVEHHHDSEEESIGAVIILKAEAEAAIWAEKYETNRLPFYNFSSLPGRPILANISAVAAALPSMYGIMFKRQRVSFSRGLDVLLHQQHESLNFWTAADWYIVAFL